MFPEVIAKLQTIPCPNHPPFPYSHFPLFQPLEGIPDKPTEGCSGLGLVTKIVETFSTRHINQLVSSKERL